MSTHPAATPPTDSASRGAGQLVLAGTPIGDVEDASPRLRRLLTEADVIAAEDTRRLTGLLQRLGVMSRAKVVSYFEGNEATRTPGLIDAVREGATVVLITDAGMPSVSDPGYRLVSAAVEAGVPLTTAPGPSAVLTALAVSGLPVDRFCFEGFLPRKKGERSRRLAELVDEKRTMVFFEAPHRLAAFLTDAAAALGEDRPAAVCRELTKTYEEVRRDGLAALARWAADGVRGEITIVISGAAHQAADPADLVSDVEGLVAEGQKLKAAVNEVAARARVPRNALYQAVLDSRREE